MDNNKITKPMRISLNPDKEFQQQCEQIHTMVQRTKPTWINNPDERTYLENIARVVELHNQHAVPMTAIADLINKLSTLVAVEAQMLKLERRTARPKSSKEETKTQILDMLKHHIELFKNSNRGNIQTNVQIIVNEVHDKRINNYDLGSYMERCNSVEELRKMCGQAAARKDTAKKKKSLL